jgi:hypothetical protein
MKKCFCVVIGVALTFSAAAFADSVSLQGALVNSSTAGIADPTAGGTPRLTGTLDATTGLGAITFTDTKPGLGFFDIFVDLSLSKPFSNEFGATGGSSLATGQSWQIDVPDYWCNTPACQSIGLPSGTPDPNDPTANIISNTLANNLSDQNGVPGNLSNFLNDCGAEPNAVSPAQNSLCNNDVALAMGFTYILPAGSQEIISFTVSQTAPASGFFLEQLHPIDAANLSGAGQVFLSGSARQVSAIPEPSTLAILILVVAVLMFSGARRTTVRCPISGAAPRSIHSLGSR